MSLQHNDLAKEFSCRNENGPMMPISRGKSCSGLRMESYGAARKTSQHVRMRAERDLPFKLSSTRKLVCQFATQNSTVSPSDAIGKLVAGSRRRPQKQKKHATTGYSATAVGPHTRQHRWTHPRHEGGATNAMLLRVGCASLTSNGSVSRSTCNSEVSN